MGEENQKRTLKHIKGRIENSISGFIRGSIVGILVILQFTLMVFLPLFLHEFTVYFYSIMEIISMIFILVLTNENRSSSYKIAWLCIGLVFPISGSIMFMLWGKMGAKSKIQKRALERILAGNQHLEQDPSITDAFWGQHPVTARMSKYMTAKGAPLWKNNKVNYFSMGEDAFEELFIDLENAKDFILINFFIVAEGALWDRLHEIMVKKIREGVEVKFMYDDFGALLRTRKDFAKDLIAEGFEIQIFNPVHKYTAKLFMNYRDHQKIVVIDGNVGYTGGFNIADEYANLVDRFGRWKDTGVRVEGESVWGLTVIFLQMWNVCCDADVINFDRYRPTKKFQESDTYIHVLSDGPAYNPMCFIETMYKQMINYAGEKLYVMTPYLVLEEYMIQSMIEAVGRGVDVRIVTPSIPDKKNVKWLTVYNYGLLLEHGVKIYEYTPGFIHAKVIVNEHCGIVGTINMDYRSFYLHYENGVWIYDRKVIDDIMEDFETTFSVSKEISYEEWLQRPFALKAIQYVLNVFSTLV